MKNMMHKKWNLTSCAMIALIICTALVFMHFPGSIANAAITANGNAFLGHSIYSNSFGILHIDALDDSSSSLSCDMERGLS